MKFTGEKVRNILWVLTLIVVLVVAAGGAHMVRYTSIDQSLYLWDRWEHRYCIVNQKNEPDCSGSFRKW